MDLSIQQLSVQSRKQDLIALSVILKGDDNFLVTVSISVLASDYKGLSLADIEKQAIAKAKENLNFC